MATHTKCSELQPAVKVSSCDYICLTRSLNHVQIRACQCRHDLQVRVRETWRRCSSGELEMTGYASSERPGKLSTQITTKFPKQGKSTDNSSYLLMFPYKRAKLMNKFLFPFLSDGYLGNPEKETEKSMTNMADLDNFRSVTGIAYISSTHTMYIASHRKLYSYSLETKAIMRLKFKPSGPTLLVEADDTNKLIVFDVGHAGPRHGRCISKATPSGKNMSNIACGTANLQSFSLDPLSWVVFFGTETLVFKVSYGTRDNPRKIARSRSLFCLVHYKGNDEVIYSSENKVLFLSVLTQKLKKRVWSFRSKPTSLVVRKDLLFISLSSGRLFTYSLNQRKLFINTTKIGVKDVKCLLCSIDI